VSKEFTPKAHLLLGHRPATTFCGEQLCEQEATRTRIIDEKAKLPIALLVDDEAA
jgi:hypothetical protein